MGWVRRSAADPSERVLGPSTGQQSASKVCPGCGASFEREAPAQKYCGEDCRIKRRNERARAYKRRRQDAEWRERTAQLRQLHEREGYLNGAEAGNATSAQNHTL
jgi:hypothetical protein